MTSVDEDKYALENIANDNQIRADVFIPFTVTRLRGIEEAAREANAATARDLVNRSYTAMKVTLDHIRLAPPREGPIGEERRGRRKHRELRLLSNRIIDQTREYVGAIRDAIGWEVDLAVDCHGRFSVGDAIRMGKALEDFRLLFYEEPTPPETLDALCEVKRAVNTPIAAGERLLARYGFWDVLSRQAMDIVQPDVTNAGGLWECKKIAAMAETKYMTVSFHNPNGILATAANIHLAATLPNLLIVETLGSEINETRGREIVKEPLQFQYGYLLLPDKPGLGIELDWEAIRRFPYQPMPPDHDN